MKILLSLASAEYVAKLPKGAKVTNYEVHHQTTNKLLGKGVASTMKQVLNRLEFILPSGMAADVTVTAQLDGATIKVKDAYSVGKTGAVKVTAK